MTKIVFATVALGAAAFGQLSPSTMRKIGTVDVRYQSYNVEMVEVTGGRFWAPYKVAKEEPKPEAKLATPGLDPSLFRTRQPIDLTNSRLRKLAAALGPAFVRVSGSWANSTYFHDTDEPAPANVPPGFGGILTRAQWKGVIDFARAVDARIVTSFAISPGTRDDSGTWTPQEARKLLAYTKSVGGTIAAAELFNEPSFAEMAGAPKGYTAAQYGKDFARFSAFAKTAAPEMLIAGPGSVGEPSLKVPGIRLVKSEDMLRESGDNHVGVFSYHFYGGVSQRCAGASGIPQAHPERALTEEWLARTDADLAFYTELRNRFEPGKPIWLTETGETACGGNPWASTFLDTFRYVDQLGRLAKQGVQMVAHNTLAASDYALIDEETMTPRPSYWAAVLWRRLMGSTVLEAGPSPAAGVHLYAHCLTNRPGGVAILAINADRTAAHELELPLSSEQFVLTAQPLDSTQVELNRREVKLAANGDLPKLAGRHAAAGHLRLMPASITFLAVPDARNAACSASQR